MELKKFSHSATSFGPQFFYFCRFFLNWLVACTSISCTFVGFFYIGLLLVQAFLYFLRFFVLNGIVAGLQVELVVLL